jgi:hypothetical protein
VSGTLTHNGAPLPDMAVTFAPVDGSRPSSGLSDAGGRFTLRFKAEEMGAVGGEHTVSVAYVPSDPDEQMAMDEGTLELSGDLKTVIDKYGNPQDSPCKITIDSSQENLQVKLD